VVEGRITLARNCKFFLMALVRCLFYICSCSREIYNWSLEEKYICKCNMYFCKNTSLSTGGCSTYKTSIGARTGIGWVKRLSKVLGAFQISYGAMTMTVAVEIVRFNKSSDSRPMCANADRAPTGLRMVYGRCHVILNVPPKRHTGAVDF